MATFEITEYAVLPVMFGNAQPIAPLPYLKHSIGTVATPFQLQADTVFIEIDRASADFTYKLGASSSAVSSGNAPAADGSNAPTLKTTDAAKSFSVQPGYRWIGTTQHS